MTPPPPFVPFPLYPPVDKITKAPAILEAVRQKCIEANPYIVHHDEDKYAIARPIRLADICLALMMVNEWTLPTIERLMLVYTFRRDSLDEQPPETIALLHSFLCRP